MGKLNLCITEKMMYELSKLLNAKRSDWEKTLYATTIQDKFEEVMECVAGKFVKELGNKPMRALEEMIHERHPFIKEYGIDINHVLELDYCYQTYTALWYVRGVQAVFSNNFARIAMNHEQVKQLDDLIVELNNVFQDLHIGVCVKFAQRFEWEEAEVSDPWEDLDGEPISVLTVNSIEWSIA